MAMPKFFKTMTSIGLPLLAIGTPALAQLPLTKPTPMAKPLAPTPKTAEDRVTGKTNQEWWPDRLDLTALRRNEQRSNPYQNFDYAAEFSKLDLTAVKADIAKLLTTSQPWWPADYGTYAPFFIRMTWHNAGTYRAADGRGGEDGAQQRFEPLSSWPDNANLDKARRLLWPIKQKYGRALSWGDLIVLTGNVALEQMGFKVIGFGGGRRDDWAAEEMFWGPEREMLTVARYDKDGKLIEPLANSTQGLIYVNPEGHMKDHDPVHAIDDIRQTFSNMGMDDRETALLIAGGHTIGKAHSAHDQKTCQGKEPAAADMASQGLGWHSTCATGVGKDAITSPLEGAWSQDPTHFTNNYNENLLKYNWVKTKSPGGGTQWEPDDKRAQNLVPDAFDKTKRHAPMMMTTDVSLKLDPAWLATIERYRAHPDQFKSEFGDVWFKLTHRDLGPKSRYLGNEVPEQDFIWQDPVPAAPTKTLSTSDVADLGRQIMASGLTVPQLVRTAWAAAASFRNTDWRGGANGGRLALAPERTWAVNDPQELAVVLPKLEAIRDQYNGRHRDRPVSLADLIVLGGSVAVEKAAADAGTPVKIPFMAGRTDASQEQTDVKSFNYLEPKADGFRNYYLPGQRLTAPEAMVDKASTLGLTTSEMTVLIGGMRALNANAGGSSAGVLTTRPGLLTNDFFVNLLDMNTAWAPMDATNTRFVGKDRNGGQIRWYATPVDLSFGYTSELRAVSEVYATRGSQQQFVNDFAAAWTKVMNADRF
jgi:catalase-peroxidase